MPFFRTISLFDLVLAADLANRRLEALVQAESFPRVDSTRPSAYLSAAIRKKNGMEKMKSGKI